MILVDYYAIWPPIPKTIFIKHCRVEIIAFPFVLFHSDRFLNVCWLFSVSNSLLHICSNLNSSSCQNVLILLSLSGVTTLSLRASVCAACMLAYRCLQMKWWAAVTFVAIPSQKALLMCPYISSGKFSVLALRCSRALLHNLQLTSDRWLIFASHLATGMIPEIAIISRLLCLQGTCGSIKYFPKNALLSFCRNMKSAVHVPYAGWLILPCSALACTHDFKNFLSSLSQSNCSAARPSPCFDTIPHIVTCVCSPLCRHLYTIFHIFAWVCSSVSKHL